MIINSVIVGVPRGAVDFPRGLVDVPQIAGDLPGCLVDLLDSMMLLFGDAETVGPGLCGLIRLKTLANLPAI